MLICRSLVRLALFAACVLLAVPAGAQALSNFPSQAAPATAPGAPVPGIQQQGFFLIAPITVDGAQVFSMATVAGGRETMTDRYLNVESAISQLLSELPSGRTIYAAATLQIVVQHEAGQEVLAAVDAQHESPTPIVTVTEADAEYQHLTTSAVAQLWKQSLQSALSAALIRREPGHILRNERITLILSIALAMVTGLTVLALRLGRRHPRIEHITEQVIRVLALAWAIGIIYSLLLFPETSAWGRLAVDAGRRIAVIWVGALLLDAYLGFVIARFTKLYARGGRGENHARHVRRAPTIRVALSGFKRFAVIFIASLATLSALQIPIASVVTIGGIAALTLGFAAQSLVRDSLNGFLVLLEDQYVVGDYVMVGDYNGIVENLTFRIVQIRDARGSLISIPHSSISQVVNASRGWTRVDYRVTVDPQADVEAAISSIRTTIEDLADEDCWKDAIIEGLEFIGVQTISKNGVVLRASVRTAPMRQFDVRRVLNERVLSAFKAASIPLGTDPEIPSAPASNASPDPT